MEIRIPEQIECIDRQISFQEEILKFFETEDLTIISDIKHDIACLKAVRETLLFDYSLESVAQKYQKETANGKGNTIYMPTAN